MSKLTIRLTWFGLLGFAWLGILSHGQAWEHPNVKVDTVFKFRVDINVGPQIKRPTAPWYAYFPADPNINPNMQSTPFPPWPGQFPPSMPPADAMKKASAQSYPQSGPMQTSYWPTGYAYGSNLQPVGYAPNQAPSYWYRQR